MNDDYGKLTCTKCGSGNIRVLDSRTPKGNENIVRRRRMCRDCGERFTTYELRATDLKTIAYNMYYCEFRDKINGAFEKIVKDISISGEKITETHGESIIHDFCS